jgi:hypothetical protein
MSCRRVRSRRGWRALRWWGVVAILFAAIGGLPGFVPGALAAPIVVTNGNDSGAGSLRQAIADATHGDAISFASGVSTVTLTTGELVIAKELTIDGGTSGVTIRRSAAAGTPGFRILHILGGNSVTLIGLTIANGRDESPQSIEGGGGGIRNSGTGLTLVRCVITGNTTPHGGGGILNFGGVTVANTTLTDSTVSGNSAGTSGGGIFSFGGDAAAAVELVNSTVSDNAAGASGGGIWNGALGGTASLTATNSTVSGNTAPYAGGIYNTADTDDLLTVWLNHVTLADNTATSSLGNAHQIGTITFTHDAPIWISIEHSIATHSDPGVTDYFSGTGANVVWESGGYNVSRKELPAPAAAGDLADTDPLLGPLADNGGPTRTRVPGTGSPAIDRIPADECGAVLADQRGIDRPYNGGCDSGAVEVRDEDAACDSGFADVPGDHPACAAIRVLTSQNIIRGYATNPPTFGPDDGVQRAQVAAFLVRALVWQGEPTGPRSFTDFGALVEELRVASLILANKCDGDLCVARGYERAGCTARGRSFPCFGPNDGVTRAQVISFVARAFQFDETYAWEPRPDLPHPYSGVPAVHEPDVRTYSFYAGLIPDAPTTVEGWSAPASRAWIAMVLYQALLGAS